MVTFKSVTVINKFDAIRLEKYGVVFIENERGLPNIVLPKTALFCSSLKDDKFIEICYQIFDIYVFLKKRTDLNVYLQVYVMDMKDYEFPYGRFHVW